jgi:hypothetical protein
MSELKNILQNELKDDNNIQTSKKRGRPSLKKEDQVNNSASFIDHSPQTSAASTVPMGAPLADDSRANRKKRKPVGTQDRIKVATRPGYHTHIVMVKSGREDRHARVQEFIDAGYTVRETVHTYSERSKEPSVMGSNLISLGRGDYGVVMDIPEELHREDIENAARENKERMDEMSKARHINNQYINRMHIDYKTK